MGCVHVEIIGDGELKERFFIRYIDVEFIHFFGAMQNLSECIISSH